MTTYTIQINEHQRALIEEALEAWEYVQDQAEHHGEPHVDHPGNEHIPLIDLFRRLPEDAKDDTPQTVHGFAL